MGGLIFSQIKKERGEISVGGVLGWVGLLACYSVSDG